MATLYITKTSGDVTTQGTLEWCIDQASDGDVIELDPAVFNDFTFVYIDIDGRELAITKSLTIRAGGNRTIVLTRGNGTARRFRIAGSSGNAITVTLTRVWSRGFTSSASSTGTMLNSNYATLTLNQCCFCACSSAGNNSGLYSSNSQVTLTSSIIEVDAGNSVNYASSATVEAVSCTFIGTVKQDMTADDSIAISPAVAGTHLVDTSKMNFNVLSTSPFAEGRTNTTGSDLNGNSFELDGPLGALQTAPAYDGVSASYGNGVITLTGGSQSLNIALNDGNDTIAYTRAVSVPTGRTSSGFKLYEMNGDSFTEITVTVAIDDDWIRAFCLAIDIPVKDAAEARQMFGDAIDKWAQR